MNVIAILASPRRNSASSAFAEYFLNKLTEEDKAGCNINKFILRGMQYSGCKGCYLCQTKATACVLTDDLTEVFESLHQADILFIATPIYFGRTPSQLLAFTNRLKQLSIDNSLTKTRLPGGKTAILLTTQQQEDVHYYRDLRNSLHYQFKQFGFTNFYTIGKGLLGIEFDLNDCKDFYDTIDDCVAKVAAPFKR
ncbi:MAG: flavodoxin family protein [Spirochaetaceae bacterium]|nr:flavodoxin family protein [Spirochaetaceae bacterium]